MDGNKSYTICGDPLYFSPEITSNLGYDYAADLWAYGVLVFELYEGYTLFDTRDAHDETNLFKTISEFKYVDLTTATITADILYIYI
jgi:serine/threonine protein kinase